ncbi:ABC transporter ATP-binding protein [Actinacidiphila yeochonensis]|uniref:ABC transporter ATP-binding protein n=1 Tax=Actinacidiphila yeochonensis TaxID=89050 RepID=UPI002244F866|nr:ABC transporter ATP-binding protein [Actinacidiphila yeochonensis]
MALARALAVEPRVLIADEMTSALDAPTQAAVLGTLRGLQRRLGLTVLFISHSLSAVRRMSDLVAVMYLGRIVEHAEAEELFRSPRHPYTRMLLDAEPTLAVRTLPSPRLPGPPRLDDEAPDPAAPRGAAPSTLGARPVRATVRTA